MDLAIGAYKVATNYRQLDMARCPLLASNMRVGDRPGMVGRLPQMPALSSLDKTSAPARLTATVESTAKCISTVGERINNHCPLASSTSYSVLMAWLMVGGLAAAMTFYGNIVSAR